MSLDPEAIEALTTQLEADGALLHEFIHGGDDDEITTEGGVVSSLAKFLADNELDLAAKQDHSVLLTAIATVVGAAADKIIYLTGSNAVAVTGFTAAARTLLACVSTTAMIAALGVVAKDGSVAMTSELILSGNPSNALAAVPKQYADNLAAGLSVRNSCRLATTGNDTLSGLAARDGVTPIAGDRVLVSLQTAPAANGIYVAASGAWARSLDMDAWSEVPGTLVLVEEGSTFADTGWVCTANRGGTLNTTAVTWSKFFGTGLFQASSANLTTLAGLSSVANLSTLANLASVTNLGTLAALAAVTMLSALQGLATNGIVTRTAAGTVAARTITGTANQVSVTNGDGVSGNPTIALPSDVALSGSIRSPYFKSTNNAVVNDDAVLVFNPGLQLTCAILILYAGNSSAVPVGLYVVRTDNAPGVTTITNLNNANLTIATAGTVLTGTTGTDGKFNLSTDNAGNIYFENRQGAARTIGFSIFAG